MAAARRGRRGRAADRRRHRGSHRPGPDQRRAAHRLPGVPAGGRVGQPEPQASGRARAAGHRAPAGRDLHDRAVRPADQDAGGAGRAAADRARGEPRRRTARGRAGRTAAAGPRHARRAGALPFRAAPPARRRPAAGRVQPGRRTAGRHHRPRPRAGQERPGRGAPGHRHAPRRRPARPGPAGRAHRGLPGRHRRTRPVQLVGNPQGTGLSGPPRAVPGDPGGADQRAQARPPRTRRGPAGLPPGPRSAWRWRTWACPHPPRPPDPRAAMG